MVIEVVPPLVMTDSTRYDLAATDALYAALIASSAEPLAGAGALLVAAAARVGSVVGIEALDATADGSVTALLGGLVIVGAAGLGALAGLLVVAGAAFDPQAASSKVSSAIKASQVGRLLVFMVSLHIFAIKLRTAAMPTIRYYI
ncbi:MAG: hypothetical protein ABI901_14975 [Roseiflexaceae bacterium]